jgi:hypothetical protein
LGFPEFLFVCLQLCKLSNHNKNLQLFFNPSTINFLIENNKRRSRYIYLLLEPFLKPKSLSLDKVEFFGILREKLREGWKREEEKINFLAKNFL